MQVFDEELPLSYQLMLFKNKEHGFKPFVYLIENRLSTLKRVAVTIKCIKFAVKWGQVQVIE